jgi:hypothetical protein
LFDTGIIDLGFKGPAYTWTNKPTSFNALHVRLDRVVVASLSWCNLFPEVYVNHIPRTRRSDHAPIMLRTRQGSDSGGNSKLSIGG